ncbi:sensor histidine kinase [Streptomyces sp. NPDC004111]|uniref:sensor histidine kinase n=1 Tax=Streptomyces sp. NPDC004111 TaxID=3364690 RepID=UPI00367FC1F5
MLRDGVLMRRLRSPRGVDAVLTVGLAVSGCLAGWFLRPAPWPAFDGWAIVLTWAIALPLLWQRAAPLAALLACCGGLAVYLACGYQPSLNFWVPPIALTGLATRGSRPKVVAGALATAAVLVHSGVAAHVHPVVVAVQAAVVPPVALAFGRTQRALARRNDELRAITLELARHQERETALAVADERLHIARELHDTISQHMAVITLQTGVAQYLFTADPPTAHNALSTAADAGRAALDELRRLLLVLRADASDESAPDPAGTPSPLARIPEYAHRLEASGLRVELRTTGTARPLHPGLELCVLRVVQEALTNVVKHSPADRAQVTLDFGGSHLQVDVIDPGGEGKPAISAPGSGSGLPGMRERAKIWNGSLVTGPREQGGFAVQLRVPLQERPSSSASV